jgi:RNA polymerase sigma-70 factor (ECF subfamily)
MEFEDFYREHRDGLWGLCYLATLDAETAADACQEAMMRAWDRWDALAGQAPLAWVRQVGLNLCRSWWRRTQRELRLLPRVLEFRSAVEPVDVDLVMALRRLPRRQREAVGLRYWGDLSVAECAQVMGVSVGSVNQHLARARASLQSGGDITVAEGLA